MELKRVVNFVLIGVITYCFGMWVFFGIGFFLGMDMKAYVEVGILSSCVLAVAAAFYVSSKIKYAKYEVPYKEKSSFLKEVNQKMRQLGFEQKSVKDNKYKYQAFLWFSLVDPKINVRLKDRKAVIKGRKQDVDNLISHLNIQL